VQVPSLERYDVLMDVPLVGERSRMLIECYRRIRRTTDSDEVDDLVTTINALTIPRSYTYVSPDDGQIHLVVIEDASIMRMLERGGRMPAGLMSGADVVWRFEPQSGVWNVIKDRTGIYESLCPIKCGGIPLTVQRGYKP